MGINPINLKSPFMSVPFNISSIINKALSLNGIESLKSSFPTVGVSGEVVTFADAIMLATDDLVESYSDWDEDQGFGSSDCTYATKTLVDSIIFIGRLNGKLMTEFVPSLSVVEYSEASHHSKVQRIESGL